MREEAKKTIQWIKANESNYSAVYLHNHIRKQKEAKEGVSEESGRGFE